MLRHNFLSQHDQRSLVEQVIRLTRSAPFYQPVMPRSGKPFSVEQTNFGELGWISDSGGYRYSPVQPKTGMPWPAIPEILKDLWQTVAQYPFAAQCCLVNLYRVGAKMGLHQDRDETNVDAPVVSVSLGDAAVFRFGGTQRKNPTQSVKLTSGDVLIFGGTARRMFHGIDRVIGGSSTLVSDGRRINLTLRRVTPA